MGNLWVSLFGQFFEMPEFIAGILFGVGLTLVARRLTPIGDWISDLVQQQSRYLTERVSAASIDRYRQEVISHAQSLHISKPLFALDEVAVEPRLLAPPQPDDPQKPESVHHDALSVLPNLPDWTYLSGVYRATTISIPEGMAHGANLMITGPLGSGKTTALAYLAIQVATRDPRAGVLAEHVPVYIHAANLALGRKPEKEPLKALGGAAQQSVSPRLSGRIPAYVRSLCRQGRALLLLDGLDEMSPQELPTIAAWLGGLLEEFPQVRVVAAGPINAYDGLTEAGLYPATIAPWAEHETRTFLDQWGQSWQQFVIPNLPKKRIMDIDPALLTGWLAGTTRGMSPLEITLRVWASFAGDVRGKHVAESYTAYFERMLDTHERQSADAVAVAWINSMEGAVRERSLRRGTPVNELVEAGLLIRRLGNRYSFAQPAVGAYLAAQGMAKSELVEGSLTRGWCPAETSLTYYASFTDVGDLLDQYLEDSGDPLESELLFCARWLREAPASAPWRAKVLRALATIASNTQRPYGLRLRAVHALASTSESSVAILFRRLLASDNTSNKVLGALGLGGFRDEASVKKLIDTVYQDPNLQVRQAACLALAGVGTDQALEGLGQVLLEGDEAVRLAAAEALASHPDEGYNMLKDAMDVENLLTRRAAVFGLARIPAPWALEILASVQVEDDQWVVRGAAAEVLDRMKDPPWKITPPIQEVANLPWLIEFAAREGLGIAPGPAAYEMVRRALNKGTSEEKLAALEAIAWTGAKELGIELRQALQSTDPLLRDAAYEALWRMRAAGIEVHTAPVTPPSVEGAAP